MTAFYPPAARALQDEFDSRRLADRLEQMIVHQAFTPADIEFIQRQRHFFLATVDAAGMPQCSFKGGDPGFIRVTSARELLFPCYDGNGMLLSAGNVAATGKAGLLFCDFEAGKRLRVNGTATLLRDDPRQHDFPGAFLLVRVEAEAIFGNCPRYLPRYALVEPSPYVPREGCLPLEPEWKSKPGLAEVVPPRRA